MSLGLFHFQLLHQVLDRIHLVFENEEELGSTVLESVSAALDAEGGSIFKLKEDGTLFPVSSYGAPIDRLRALPFATGRGVVGWVVQHAQPVKVDFPGKDTRFVGSADAATGFKTRNIIAAPIVTHGRIVGVIEFLNKKEGVFTLPDLELVSMIGREVGIAFENTRLVKDLRSTQALLDAMTDSLPAGILIVDGQRVVLRTNPSGLKILGSRAKPGEWIGKRAEDVLESTPELLAVVDAVMKSGVLTPRSEVNVTVGGKTRIVGYSGVPVIDSSGHRLGSALLFQDITAFVKPK